MKIIGDKYGPAMEITDQRAADAYFEACIKDTMTHGKSRKEAEHIERSNLGYFAGYYSDETRQRVERLFKCAHPIFGPIACGKPTQDEIFQMGMKRGEKVRRKTRA